MALLTNKQFLGIAALGIGGALYVRHKTGELFSETLNPMSDENAVYTAVNTVGSRVTGREHFSLGAWFYEITHPNEDLSSFSNGANE
ncbi:MAG: hypothetical protein CMQ38_05810 [Gammaproteobacteria bacterium]|nr:hypothetical protein [Gammaproteobacteria bacterium]